MGWTSRDGRSSVELESWGLRISDPEGAEEHIVGPAVVDVELCPTMLRVRCGESVHEIGGFSHDDLAQIEASLLRRDWSAPPADVAEEEALIEEAERRRHLPKVAAGLVVLAVVVAVTIVGFGLARRSGDPTPETTSTEASPFPSVAECRMILADWAAAEGDDGAMNRQRDRFIDAGCDRVCRPGPGTPGGTEYARICD